MLPLRVAVSSAPSVEDASVPLWERTMRAAVASARAGQLQTAIDGYRRALDIACELIDRRCVERADDCVAALVVSFHNLADAQTELDAPERAVKLFCDAHEALIALYLDAERPPALRQAALHHTRETHSALVAYAAAHGMHPLIARAFDIAGAAFGEDCVRPH